MFGPNPRSIFRQDEPTFHHRGNRYAGMLSELQHVFRGKFGLSDDTDVLFLSGSGTLANEAVAASLRGYASVLDPEFEFAKRFSALLTSHKKLSLLGADAAVRVRIAYETADAKFMLQSNEQAQIVDMVSAFPYYRPLASTHIWTTVSSKQLGALPVCAFVVVSPKGWELLEDDSRYSYLNLARYKSALQKGQSPHTPAMSLLDDTLSALYAYDPEHERARIDNRRTAVLNALPEGAVFGTGPVLCLRRGALPAALVAKWDLYPSLHGPQIFLYAESDETFGALLRDLEKGW